MTYYVIRVTPRGETKFIAMAHSLMAEAGAELVFPRRRMTQTKRGKRIEAEVPLFPGYVFLKVNEIDVDLYWKLKRIDGFLHYLKQGHSLSELSDRDLEILKHFLSFGEVIDKSRVFFNEEQRIHVVSGPMEGLEGQIIKVDRRKKRAKILLNFRNANFYIDLGFEDITLKEAPA